MRAIKNLRTGMVIIVSDDDIIENGYLHDCYGNYGQKFSGYDAGDYSFDNSESTFMKDAKEQVLNDNEENIDYNDYNIDVISDTEVEVSAYDDGNQEKAKKIQDELNEWALDNVIYADATYITYWDGHNHKSLIIDSDITDDREWVILEGEEEEFFIGMYENASFSDWSQGTCSAQDGDYTIMKSCWEGDFEIASIYLTDSPEYY